MSRAFDWLWTFLGVTCYANHIRSKLGWRRSIFSFSESLMVSIKLVKTGDLNFPLRNLWRRLIARVRRELWIHWFLLENAILINDPTLSSFLLHFLLLRDEWIIYDLQVAISDTLWITRSVGVKRCDRANLAWRLRCDYFFFLKLFIQHVVTRFHVAFSLIRSDRVVAGLNPRDNIDKRKCFIVEVP